MALYCCFPQSGKILFIKQREVTTINNDVGLTITPNGVIENRYCDCNDNPDTNCQKYKLNKLAVEITRKCNQNCKHCMRGEAQDLTITTDIIDKIFDNISDVRTMIGLTGGEPLLEVDTIQYFCEKLINSNWNPQELQIITNGDVSSETKKRIIEILCRVCDKKKIICRLLLSVDQFHKKVDYIKLLNSFRDEIQLQSKTTYKIYCEIMRDKANRDNLLFLGRAKDNEVYLKNNDIQLYYKPDLKYPHRINIEKDRINCFMSILANGNVSLLQDYEYVYADRHSLGNLLNESFKSIVDSYNGNVAICDCWENKYYYVLLSYYHFCVGIQPTTHKYILLNLKRYELTLNKRLSIAKQYPNMSKKDIQSRNPIPKEREWITMLVNVHNICNSNDLITTLNENGIDKLLLVVKSLERNV